MLVWIQACLSFQISESLWREIRLHCWVQIGSPFLFGGLLSSGPLIELYVGFAGDARTRGSLRRNNESQYVPGVKQVAQ